ncbi:MAG: hypothetical protein A3C44_06880 [Gammaproteobacteria bacterium RIFCSPHIGHO2_02_FULL_39_13]|nr:MAG: hypothetical protein A3C44_06880 [Gammaproteobacteria bacterium RIFCSPHIGHO2_02_FULL_39_13]
MVIAIMVILFFSIILSYRFFMQKNQLTSLVNQVVSAVHDARFVAMTSHATTRFCARDMDWQQGQLIVNEKNQQVIRVFPAMPAGYHLHWKSTLGESDALHFRSNGFTRGQQGSFFICTKQADSAQIIVLRTGRIRSVIGKISGCDDPRN